MAVDAKKFSEEVAAEYGGPEEKTPAEGEKPGYHGRLLREAIAAKDDVALEECVRSIMGM